MGKSFQSVFVMVVVSALILGGLGTRLAYLQLFLGERNKALAEENRIRLIPKPPERGRIFDRNGKLMATSRISYSAFVWPIALGTSAEKLAENPQWQVTRERLAQILKIPESEIEARLAKEGYNSPYRIRIARGLTIKQVVAILEAQNALKGVEIDAETVRYYPNGDLAAHVLGYTGEIIDEELDGNVELGLERLRDQGYRLGDVLGKSGAELALESQLRGEWGGQQVEVDAAGQVLKVLGEKPSIAGQDVTLTIDLELQKAAEQALGQTKGATVAIDPRNGAVLAMVSRPTYDPNIFSTNITESQWAKLESKGHPFVNRALQGFAPASTYKIVTTTAALESGQYDPGTVLPTYPYIQVGGIKFWDWNQAGFGPLGFRGAMAWSSDTFFYQVAQTLGGEIQSQWSRNYGFGDYTGIELREEEASGLVPDEAWKRANLDEGWYAGDSINMSIGQGFLQASPLQVAVMFAVPANGGYRVQPHVQKDNEAAQNWRQPMDLQPSTLNILQQGLRDVVVGGTGGALNVAHLPPVAGKTGTAEDPPRLSHAWFGAYAPYDNPEIVVVTFAENSGGGGGAVAAPMARQILEAYFAQ
jgi:penicillin-binding protein 2